MSRVIGSFPLAGRLPRCGQQVPVVMWPRIRDSTAVNGMRSGSRPAVPAARAASVAVMLCTSSSARVSCRARAGERPRSTRPVPLTVFLRCRYAISACHLSAYRAVISRAGNASASSRVVSTLIVVVLALRVVRAQMVKLTSRATVPGSRGRVLSLFSRRRLPSMESDSRSSTSSDPSGRVLMVLNGTDFAPFLARQARWAPRAENRIHRSMEKNPRSARLRIPAVNEPSSSSARAFSPSW